MNTLPRITAAALAFGRSVLLNWRDERAWRAAIGSILRRSA
jgi:hypothetical protein